MFLPAAGRCNGGDVLEQGDYGFYWYSTPVGSTIAYGLGFRSDHQGVYVDYRYNGWSVRAVLAE